MNADEITLFEESDVKITNRRVIIGPKTYALNNITSVELGRKDPSSCGPLIFIMGGILLVVVGLANLEQGFGEAIGWLLVGAGSIALGVLVSKSAKPDYTVKVGSSSGESNIMASPDQAAIQKIVDAINDAIVRRT